MLCLEDRTPLGRVTEVFGPIQAPLYALRYSGNPGAPPDSVTPGAHVCAVAKYALALEPDIVQQRVRWSPVQPVCVYRISSSVKICCSRIPAVMRSENTVLCAGTKS